MARIALVTGGTRGLGRAIALAFKEDGCDVAAVYRGNDEAAKNLLSEAGIATYKWDVADFNACKLGVGQIEREFGPIDLPVNNAGIPVGPLGAPSDVARTAVFLARDEAGFIAGATFSVNGGQYMG